MAKPFSRFAAIVALVALVALLAACATERPAPPPPPPETPPPAEPAPPAVPPEPAPPPPPRFEPRAFLGVERSELEGRFGRPDLVRREGPAEVWQYVSGPCVLHFFFYPGSGTAAAPAGKVEHVEAKTRPGPWGEDLTPEAACAGEFKSAIGP